ncbi:MAG: VIT domain-containing protein, partial [Isosphaeraceae bacterium]
MIDQIDMSGQNRELIDELVSLSTRYGILTPYTAFLADERVPLHAAMQNARQAGENLVALRSVSGGFGVAQREAKQFYMRAEKASGAPGGLLMDQQGET